VGKFAGGAHKNTNYISVLGCGMILLQQSKGKGKGNGKRKVASMHTIKYPVCIP
jgi:hypothetical protein